MFFRSLMAATLAAAFSFAAAGSAFAASDNGTGNTSTNWAGYAVPAKAGQSFNFVTATWVEPALLPSCPAAGAPPNLVTFSVGFDGYGNATHERVGTTMQCAPTGPPPAPFGFKEMAYYELCTGPGTARTDCTTVRLTPAQFPLQHGDRITAAAYFADGSFTFVLHNHRTHQTYKATVAGNGGTRTSAEAIVDVPVPFGGAPLTNFGQVTFSNFVAHASSGDEEGNHDGNHENNNGSSDENDGEDVHSKPVAITMSGPKSPVRAVPGAIHGHHFTVTWKAYL